MTRWLDVGALDELKFTPGAPVMAEGRWLALFRDGDTLRCIDNACPHAGAPLCDGSVMQGKVVCFLHCWEFDLRSGACDVGEQWNVQTYAVQVTDGRVLVELPS